MLYADYQFYIEKYNGSLKQEQKDGIFRAELIFNLQ